jgi:hypothetical protein
MPSLLKKKPEAAGAAPVLPPWHPNFRNFERLPDTKVVRTAFFVNAVAIVIALVALLWFSYQEYELHDLNRQAEQWQTQIDRDKRGSDAAIALYKKFQAEAARVAEVEAFGKSKPVITDLLLNLGRTLPKNIALDTFDLRENALKLTGTIRGAPDLASGYATAYVELLRADPFFAARFEEVSMVNLTRNPQTGRLSLDLLLKLRSPDKEAKKP